MTSRTIIAIAVLLAVLLPSEGHALEKVKLQLKWYHQFQFAGYYMALEKGYYAEEGLDVEILERKPGTSTIESVEKGQADFGIESTDIYVSRSNGHKVKVAGAIFQHSPAVLIANLPTLADLKGKRVMLSTQANISEIAMLRKHGVALSDLVVLPHSQNIDDLIAGRVDAITAYSTNEPFQLEQRGYRFNIFPAYSYGIDFYGDCVFVTDDFAARRPETVDAFMRATARGWRYAFDYPIETVDLITVKYKSRKSREALIYEASVMRQLVMPDIVGVGHMERHRWETIARTYADMDLMDTPAELDDFLYRSPEKISRKSAVIILALALAAVLITAAMMLMRKRLNELVAERTRELELSEERFRKMVSTTDLGVALTRDGFYIEVNDAFMRMCGYDSRDELLGMSLLETIAPEAREVIKVRNRERESGKQVETKYKSMGLRKDGTVFPFEISVSRIELKDGVATMAIVEDITQRQQNAQRIERSLREKEVLLKEIHHRVKNNMAVINSLLSLQSNYIDDKKYLDMFNESQGRIRSMALVHELLYRSDDFSRINAGEYIETLARGIASAFSSGRDVRLNTSLIPVKMAIDELIPLGLIINELLTNSFKYGLGARQSLVIDISLKRHTDGRLVLSIKDDGEGLPEGFDIKKTGGLGLKLVRRLVAQIDGDMTVVNRSLEFTIIFPEEVEHSRHIDVE